MMIRVEVCCSPRNIDCSLHVMFTYQITICTFSCVSVSSLVFMAKNLVVPCEVQLEGV